jgi:hypothetical protein
VRPDLPVDAHGLGRRVWVVRQRHETRGPVIDGIWKAVRTRAQVRASRREGRPEDDGVYVLIRESGGHIQG